MSIASSDAARGVALGLAVFALTACGSESTAASNEAEGNSPMSAAVSAQPTASSQAQAAQVALPIGQGIYVDVTNGGCARTPFVFFYDGANYGDVSHAEPAGDSYSSVYRIARVGSPPRGSEFYEDYRGYTAVWNTENADDEDMENLNDEKWVLGVKALGNGRFMIIQTGIAGATGRTMSSEATYQKCSFAQLSQQMQAAIRAERPQLAGGTTATNSAAVPAQSGAAFPPIEQGYYAIGVSCAQAIAGGGDLLAYLDERRFASFDGVQQVEGFQSLGGNRYRVRAVSFDENDRPSRADSVITVNGRTSFTNEYGDRHTYCPTSQVPRAIRQEWGDMSQH